MYSFFIDGVRLPVAPSKLSIKINNNNKTIDLLNLGEVNVLKSPKLSDISFKALLPSVKYPFANYDGGFINPAFYLNLFRDLKKDKKYFRFIITRTKPNGSFLFDTNILASLENYTIDEDAENGNDIVVDIKLKEYKEYSTETIQIVSTDNNEVQAEVLKERPAKEPTTSYTVQSGDTLWLIAKKQLNDGSKYAEIAKLNNIPNPNLISVGQTLRLG